MFFIFILVLGTGYAIGQDGGERPLLGVLGVGARPLAMGGAYVAAEADPSLVYWNPAGLDYAQKQTATLYYTTLLESQYGFIGYLQPTLNLGTFGVGVLYLGTGDLGRTEAQGPEVIDTFSYSDNLWLFSYSKQTPWWGAFGASFRLQRQSIDRSAIGIGADIGLIFKPQWHHVAVKNFAVGFTIQNLIPARPRLKDQVDQIPRTIRLGVAKVIPLGLPGGKATINLDLDNAYPYGSRIHFGVEFSYNAYGMLRAGINNKNLTFGAGTVYQNFRLDYSFGQSADPWLESRGAQHRISFTFEFGQTRDELRRLKDEQRVKGIEAEIRFRKDTERKENITRGLETGKQFLAAGDLTRAYREFFKIVNEYGDQQSDAGVAEARRLFDEVDGKIKTEQDQELKKRAQQSAAEIIRLHREQKIKEHFDKGKSFFETEDYIEAIEQWDKALELDSLDQQIQEFRTKAISMLKEKIAAFLTEAGKLIEQDRTLDALNLYNQVLRLSRPLSEEYQTLVKGSIEKLEKKLHSEEIVRRAADYENAGDYLRAMELFYEALQFEPDNRALLKRYEDNKARANAKKMEMTPEVNSLYNEGYRLFLAKDFENALAKFKQALVLQPLNKELIDAIDLTNRELEKRNKSDLGKNY